MTADADGRPHDLKGLVVRGVGWMMASQLSIQLLAFATSIVVARFLVPSEVGLAAEALVFSSLALVAVDFGFASVLVQRPTLSEEDKSTAFWTGLLLGVGMTLLGVGLSWPISDIYGEPKIQPLFAVLSLVFLFTAGGIVQGALLTRDLQFRSLEVRTIIATAVSCATTMSLAIAGAGSWAIIAQHLTITGASTLLLWRSSSWRPRATFSMASLRGMARFTSHVFGTRVLAWGNANLDNFLIGRYLGAASLGAYTLAFSVMVTPINRVATPISQVFFPAFSRMRERDSIAATWLRAIRMIAMVVVAPMLGLIVVAPDFVNVIFGAKWHAAVPVLQILAPVGLLQALMVLNGGILQSLDRTRVYFRYTVAASIATVGAFALGLIWGLEGVAWAYLAVTLVLTPIFLWLTTQVAGISPRDWLRAVSGVMEAGLGMLGAVFAAREALLQTSASPTVRLVAVVVVGALVYLPLLAWRAPEVMRELRALRDRRRGARPAPAREGAEAQV